MRDAARPATPLSGRFHRKRPDGAESGAGPGWDDAIPWAVWGLGFVLATASVMLPVIDSLVERAGREGVGS